MFYSKITIAQQSKAGFGIESNIIGGKIFKHSKRFTGPIPNFSVAADINFLWKTNGSKDWQQRRSYPTVGLGLTYTYYDASVYGQSVGIYPNLELPLIKKTNWEWTLRFGMSLGYISKRYAPYAPNWDTLNNAIGAHINNFSLLSTDVRYHLNQHWDLQAGLSFTHMSSAKFRLPNLGINFIGGHLGFRYFPNSSFVEKTNRVLSPLPDRWLLQVRQGIAMTTYESKGSAASPVFLTSLHLSRRYWGKNKIFAGIDYSYHQGIYNFLRFQGIENERSQSWKSGVYLGHEFLYGRVGLHLQFGYYIRQGALPTAPIYQKIGMNWYLVQNEKGFVKEMYVSTLLKTHFSVAELAELGIGFSF